MCLLKVKKHKQNIGISFEFVKKKPIVTDLGPLENTFITADFVFSAKSSIVPDRDRSK